MSQMPVQRLLPKAMTSATTHADAPIKVVWMEAKETQHDASLRCGPLKHTASLAVTAPPVALLSATETVRPAQEGSSAPQSGLIPRHSSTAAEKHSETLRTESSTRDGNALTTTEGSAETSLDTISPQPTLGVAEYTFTSMDAFALTATTRSSAVMGPLRSPTVLSTADDFPRLNLECPRPEAASSKAATSVADPVEDVTSEDPTAAAPVNAPQGLTDAATALAGGAEAHNERNSASSRLPAHRRSKRGSMEDVADLTEEEEKRIAKCVQETVRLNFSSSGLGSSSVTTTGCTPTESHPMTCPAPDQVKSVLVDQIRSDSVPPQARLGAEHTSHAPPNDVVGHAHLSSPRRRHSVHERMTSADAFLPRSSLKDCPRKPSSPAVRLSLARLGRHTSSLDDLPPENSVKAATAPIPAATNTTDEDTGYNAEISAILNGSGMVSAEIDEAGTDAQMMSVAPAVLPHSPVSILRKSSSVMGSSGTSVAGSSRTSVTDLYLSDYDQREESNLLEHEDRADDGAAAAGSPGSGALATDINKSWSSRRTRRRSTSRQGKPNNGRDTPRSVGFIGDELADCERDEHAEHELNKKRILEKMRSRRHSMGGDPS